MANICVRYSERGRNHKSPIMKPTTVEIKDILIAELMRADDSLKSKTVNDAMTVVFRHADTLRLTYTGYIIMRTQFTAYSFEIGKPMMAKHLMALSRLSYPYFITQKRLVLFSEMDATVVTLSGSVETFLENNI